MRLSWIGFVIAWWQRNEEVFKSFCNTVKKLNGKVVKLKRKSINKKICEKENSTHKEKDKNNGKIKREEKISGFHIIDNHFQIFF